MADRTLKRMEVERLRRLEVERLHYGERSANNDQPAAPSTASNALNILNRIKEIKKRRIDSTSSGHFEPGRQNDE